ncbi:MAG: DUF1553 domain-containing protein [Zavarzinella sp.]
MYRYVQDNVATYHPLDQHDVSTYRRAVYHQNARAAHVDILSDFDCPDPAMAAPRRAKSITPVQALSMMNHRFIHEMATSLAAELEKSPQVTTGVELAFLKIYGRPPTEQETQKCTQFVKDLGWQRLALVLFNSNEAIFIR